MKCIKISCYGVINALMSILKLDQKRAFNIIVNWPSASTTNTIK